MGLIHSRARKQRDKAEAALLKEQRRQVRAGAAARGPTRQQAAYHRLLRWMRALTGG